MHDDFQGNDPRDYEFAQDSRTSRRSSSTNWTWIIIGGIAVGGLIIVGLCCGGGWFAFRFGMDVLTEEVRAQIEDDAVIQQHVGTIQTMSVDYTKSAAVEGDDVFVFRIEGDKGSGYLTVESVTNMDGMEEVTSGSLKLDSGETFPLLLEDAVLSEDAPEDGDE